MTLSARPRRRPPESPRWSLQPVFVVGVPRSGTTWVQRMLASHPEAWPLLETYMFSRQVGLGALLRSMPAAEPQSDPLDLPPPGLGRIFAREELVAELREIAGRWLRRALRRGLAVRDREEPWHLSELDLIAEVLPNARFVNVVRDGRDVCRLAGRGSQVVVALRRLASEQHRPRGGAPVVLGDRERRARPSGPRRARCSSCDTRTPEPTRARRAGGCSSTAGCRMTRS